MSLTRNQRGQKYQNARAFNPALHDSSRKTKQLLEMPIEGVCNHCRDVIKWKIQCKKYKPLTQPAKCVKCLQRKIKQSYYTVCFDCSMATGICAKCAKESDVNRPSLSKPQEQTEETDLERELKSLSERKRRTLLRYMQKATSSSTEANVTNDDANESC